MVQFSFCRNCLPIERTRVTSRYHCMLAKIASWAVPRSIARRELTVPNTAQVRLAAYRVMREFGLVGVTVRRVQERLKADGATVGSYRELSQMVADFKREQSSLSQLPTAVVKMAETFASEIWKLALATVSEIELQRSGAATEPETAPRAARKAPRGSDRITVLRKAVEQMLRDDAVASKRVREPISASEIFRLLTKQQAELTSDRDISRDLLEAERRSRVLQRLPGRLGKWWRKDRALPSGYGAAKPVKGYVSRGTPLSQRRMGNRTLFEDAVSVLITSARKMSWEEIADELGVPAEGRRTFKEMLRNHLRVFEPRFMRDGQGKYFVEE